MPWTIAEAKSWNSEWDDRIAAKAARAANSIYNECMSQEGATDEKCAPRAIRLAKWMAKTGKLDKWDGATVPWGADMTRDAFTEKPWDGDKAAYTTAQLLRAVPRAIATWARKQAESNPGGEVIKGHLKLPFKEPDGIVNINGVRNALSRVSQTGGLPNDVRAEARAELERLLEEYKQQTGKDGRGDACLRYDEAELLPSDAPENGVLMRDVVVAKPGVFKYQDVDGTIHWEFKPPEEILSDVFLKSTIGLPITDEHPDSGLVTPETVASVTKGLTGTSPKVEDGKAVNQALIFDQELRKAVESGEKRQVSIGFLTDLVDKEGEYEGQRYDRVQTNIRVNHLAVTKRGRCGQECSIKADGKVSVGTDGFSNILSISTSPSAILNVPGAMSLTTGNDVRVGGTLYVNDIQPLSAAASQADRTSKDAVGRQTTNLVNVSQSSVVRADKGAETRRITMSENQMKLTLGKAVLDCHMDANGTVTHENCPYMQDGFQTKMASFQGEIDSFLKRLADAEKAKDEAEANVKQLQGQIAAKTDTNQLIQNKCEEMKKRSDEIEQGKGFEARMDARMSLIDLARKFIQNYAHNGKSNREIKVDVIKALRPKFVAEGKDDKFVDAYFDATIEGQQLEAEKETKAQINTVSAGNDAIEAKVAELKARSLNLKQTGKK